MSEHDSTLGDEEIQSGSAPQATRSEVADADGDDTDTSDTESDSDDTDSDSDDTDA